MHLNMKQRLSFLLLIIWVATWLPSELYAQEASAPDKKEPASYQPLTLKLSEDGSKYLRFIMWHQIWASTNNLSVEGQKTQVSTSIRRSRLLAYAQISPRFLILTHFGLNSLTTSGLSPLGNGNNSQLFLHGAWGEFKINKQLYIGGGLHYWKGLTRLSSESTLNFMTLDQSRPFIHWHSLGITDQFARHLGVYAKGQIGKFDFRLAINNPGHNPLNAGNGYGEKATSLTYSGFVNPNDQGDPTGNTIVEGYLRMNIFDKESTKLPYNVGTYLGKKKVLALGAGFFAHPNGMYNTENGNHENVFHGAIDAFLDLPTKAGALSAYSSFIVFDYGENYVSRWAGTGTAFYGHLGYYLKQAKVMPYVALQNSKYEGLTETIHALDIGLNYFINGHNAKLTLEYHRINNDPREGGMNDMSQVRLQAHIFL
ncbi:MAG: hypothetical protein Sapg2KO_08950 [Saprospiraceae bacterium]